MKQLLIISIFVLASNLGFAQYNDVQYAANGTKVSEGQYNANPGLLPSDSKEVIAQKMGLVHKIGTWNYWFDNGQQVAIEQFNASGTAIGIWKNWDNTGHLSAEINYTSGTAVYYHPNGTKAEEGTINVTGQRTGEWKGYHDNGQLNYSGKYAAAGKTGTWTYYDIKGNVAGVEHWNNGIMGH